MLLLRKTYRPASRLRFIHTDVKTSLEIRCQLFNILAVIAGQADTNKQTKKKQGDVLVNVAIDRISILTWLASPIAWCAPYDSHSMCVHLRPVSPPSQRATHHDRH